MKTVYVIVRGNRSSNTDNVNYGFFFSEDKAQTYCQEKNDLERREGSRYDWDYDTVTSLDDLVI